jgi:hypothetical protein
MILMNGIQNTGSGQHNSECMLKFSDGKKIGPENAGSKLKIVQRQFYN